MGKIWNIHTLISITFIWFLFACSTEPVEYENIKTVDSEEVAVNNDEAKGKSNKPRVSSKQTSEDAKENDNSDETEIIGSTDDEQQDAPPVEEEQLTPVDLNFAWDAPADTDIVSYKIYSRTENQAEGLLSEVVIGNLNLTAPTFTYELSEQEQTEWDGQTVFFSIVASNANGDSEKSMEFPVSFE